MKVKLELLAPAGNLDILKIAFLYGADAVYCGTPDFAMRARVGFDLDTLKEGIKYAHKLKKKVYITVNAFPHAGEIERLRKFLPELIKLKPDALIIADPGILQYVKDRLDIPIHLSTQANTTNELTARFWKEQGVERIVLARELSLKEIKIINQKVKIGLETFVHGAMCMAYSGRCQISNYLSGRDPNQGKCIQACRFKYKMYAVEEDLRKDEFFPLYEDENGTHLLNSKDLCMVDHIDDLVEAGISSFKIEGRLKTEYYVATVVRAYRQAIDSYLENPDKYKRSKGKFIEEISKSANRGFTTGFYYQKPDLETNNYASSKALSTWAYIGRVKSYDNNRKMLKFEVKNYLRVNSGLEIITPKSTFAYRLEKILVDGKPAEIVHANTIAEIPFQTPVEPDALIRVKLVLSSANGLKKIANNAIM